MTSEKTTDSPTQVLVLEGSADIDYFTVSQMYDVEKDEWYSATVYADLKWNHVIPFEDKLHMIDVQFNVSKDINVINIYISNLTTGDIDVTQVITPEYAGTPIGVYKKHIYFHDNHNRRIHRLNADDNTFEAEVFVFSERHADSATIISNGLLYNIGSFHPTDEESLCEVCDLETLKIRSIASFPVSSKNWVTDEWKHPPTLTRVSVAELNGKLYAMDVRTLKQLYVYSPDDDKWETITCGIPPYVIRGQLASCARKLICLNSGVLMYVYDPETNRWNRREQYGGHSMCVITGMRAMNMPDKMYVMEDDPTYVAFDNGDDNNEEGEIEENDEGDENKDNN